MQGQQPKQPSTMGTKYHSGRGEYEYEGFVIRREVIPGRSDRGFRVQGDHWWCNVTLDTLRAAKEMIDAYKHAMDTAVS